LRFTPSMSSTCATAASPLSVRPRPSSSKSDKRPAKACSTRSWPNSTSAPSLKQI
jgi:hypothetical protein